MPIFDVRMERTIVEGRIIRVEAKDVVAAQRRALGIARGDAEARPTEHEGEWCDGSPTGRVRVKEVSHVPSQE